MINLTGKEARFSIAIFTTLSRAVARRMSAAMSRAVARRMSAAMFGPECDSGVAKFAKVSPIEPEDSPILLSIPEEYS